MLLLYFTCHIVQQTYGILGCYANTVKLDPLYATSGCFPELSAGQGGRRKEESWFE